MLAAPHRPQELSEEIALERLFDLPKDLGFPGRQLVSPPIGEAATFAALDKARGALATSDLGML